MEYKVEIIMQLIDLKLKKITKKSPVLLPREDVRLPIGARFLRRAGIMMSLRQVLNFKNEYRDRLPCTMFLASRSLFRAEDETWNARKHPTWEQKLKGETNLRLRWVKLSLVLLFAVVLCGS
jgi:hypothetical protein